MGCNLHQGEAVANAITRIRKLLGREDDENFKVDLITYSKGAMAARCYVQSANDFVGFDYLTDYRGDVRRVVFQVGPHWWSRHHVPLLPLQRILSVRRHSCTCWCEFTDALRYVERLWNSQYPFRLLAGTVADGR